MASCGVQDKRDPIYQNHGKLVVGVGSFAAILNFPTTELRACRRGDRNPK